MQLIRQIVEKGLAARAAAKVPIRQPLLSLMIKSETVAGEGYQQLLKEELNVKEIKWQKQKGELTVVLDTTLTPELKQEGLKRELVRHINAWRKKKGLKITDQIKLGLWVKDDKSLLKEVVNKYYREILPEVISEEIVWLKERPTETFNLDNQEVGIMRRD